jgi:hypothetical protein
MSHWIKKNWWIIFSLVVLGFIIYLFATIHITLEANDKYTLFVDLILIILALITLAGYGVYRWICRGIDERVECKLAEEGHALSARLHASMGYVFWLNCLNENPLSMAIEKTKQALKDTETLDQKNYEELICRLKCNLAYYLAEAKSKGQEELLTRESSIEAHKLARYAYERARDKRNRYRHEISYEWEETYAWVLWQFDTSDDISKNKAKEIITSVLSSENISFEWRQKTKEKWDKLFSQATQAQMK